MKYTDKLPKKFIDRLYKYGLYKYIRVQYKYEIRNLRWEHLFDGWATRNGKKKWNCTQIIVFPDGKRIDEAMKGKNKLLKIFVKSVNNSFSHNKVV